ncbi:hypothetical protein CEQ07_08190 [Oligella urethralis]|uniref:tripartite tricarboxylate transporter TctB family protein n=1 Tax=Oligella urethralis TaxID=90245 RepID=UPI000CFEC0AB|nr:tripartite tricarboxylate transporter TctB family protein [Oligella urethralis]AVL71395.1 hypothetical protein CEQ07_08190 [Oligella urethralis]
MKRIFSTHAAFLVFVILCAIALNWSAIQSSATLYNLIVILPSGILVIVAALYLIFSQILCQSNVKEEVDEDKKSSLLGDVILLVAFAIFCFCLVKVGFDIATFLFVWFGIIMGGERNWWRPPVFSALFTLFLIKGFGSLFPFPMPLLVF